MIRTQVETFAVASLQRWAGRQLALPKNRSKSIPTESVEQLIQMAIEELREALHARRAGLGLTAVLSELGDAAAFVGLAMWRAGRGEHG